MTAFVPLDTMPTITWDQVPGFFDFQDIYDEAVESAPEGAVLVEVGTLFGRSALYMAQKIKDSGKNLDFYVVDLWKMWPDVIFNEGSPYLEVVKAYGSLFGAFVFYLENSGLRDYVKVLRMDSSDAAKHFRTVRPYFVFIDGNHSYEKAGQDILAWREVTDGILAGHDYDPGYPGVVRAVDDIFGSNKRKDNNSWLALGVVGRTISI